MSEAARKWWLIGLGLVLASTALALGVSWTVSNRSPPARSQAMITARPKAPPIPPDFLKADVPASLEGLRGEMEALAGWLEKEWGTTVEALEIAARLKFHTGKLDEAESLWRKALQQDPHFTFAHHGLGMLLGIRGEYDQAIQHYREAVRLAPRAAEPLLELGDLLIKAGKIDEAIDLLENDFPGTLDSIWRYNMLGSCYLQKGDLRRARFMYEAAHTRDPEDTTALYGLSVVLSRSGETTEAAKLAEHLKQIRDMERERWREERKAADELRQLSAKLADGYGKAAKLLLAIGQNECAERLAHRAVTLNPQEVDARQVLALIKLQQTAAAEAPQGGAKNLSQSQSGDARARESIARQD